MYFLVTYIEFPTKLAIAKKNTSFDEITSSVATASAQYAMQCY